MTNKPIQHVHHTQHPDTSGVLDALIRRLGSIARRARAILLLRSVLVTLSLVVGVSIVFGLIDFLLRLPMGVRFLGFGFLMYLVYRCVVRLVGPAYRFRLSPTDIALQVERHDPSLRGLLAGAVDLRDSFNAKTFNTINPEISNALAHAAITNASNRLQNYRYPSILKLRKLAAASIVFFVVSGCVLGLSLRTSDHVRIGINRIILPWTDARWPMRYPIVDLTNTAPRALDVAVPIRALIGSTSTDEHAPSSGMIDWRLLDAQNNSITNWNHSPLVPQRRRDPETGIPMYEQLIDTNRSASKHTGDLFTLEYKITTRDDTSKSKRIQLARPPALLKTITQVSLPEYAQVLANTDIVRSGTTTSSTYDSVVSPILAGSHTTVTWHLSKPVRNFGDTLPKWASDFASDTTLAQLTQPSPDIVTLDFVAQSSIIIEPGMVDEMGIPVRTPIVLSLGVLTDQNPGASIIEPTHDETVSSRALIHLQAELTDDLGLAYGSVNARIARQPAGSSGAPHELIDPTTQGILVEQSFHATLRASLSHTLDLSTLNLQPNDQVWVQALSWDLRKSDIDPEFGKAESSLRILTVLADSDLIEQIRSGLQPIRNTLRQLDEQQSQLINQLRDGELSTSTAQRSLTNRIQANKRSIDQMTQSIKRNQLDDPLLSSQLNDASSILDEAAQAGEQASDQIDRGQTPQAIEQQEIVQDRIGELLSILDRGQDSYLALRSIQQLRDNIESIRNDTAELNAQTAGRSLDQLSQEERSTLDRILERQLDAADDAASAMSTLDEQAEQLEENDPTQAQALQDAAEKGRSAQLEERLRQAGEQIASNQTSSATSTQTEVLEELEEMLEELENTIQNRDNALRRELASIIDSIQQLIHSQQTEIDRLGSIDTAQLPTDLDTHAIALNRNTLSVRDDALGAFPETRIIADLIGKAADAQSTAIRSLRETPPDIAGARRADQTSLLNLNKSLEEAQRLDEQAANRQAQRLRTQLRDAYRSALESQVALRDETIILNNNLVDNRQLSRRQRATARAIATTEQQIQTDLADLLDKTEELNEAPVFNLAHQQLDMMMSQIAEQLNQRTLSQRVIINQDASITILTTLVQVLSDQSSEKDQEDFDDGQSGGSESGSGGGKDEPVIPPVAQLVLLRSMQQLAATQTRMMDQQTEPVHPNDIEALSQLQSQLFKHAMDLIEQMSGNPSQKNPESTDDQNEPIELDGESRES